METIIVQAKAQELARALVQLKLDEVALSRVQPVDQEKLALVRAQQAALNRELAKLSVASKEAELKDLEERQKWYLKTMDPRNPVPSELQVRIEKLKAEIDWILEAPGKEK